MVWLENLHQTVIHFCLIPVYFLISFGEIIQGQHELTVIPLIKSWLNVEEQHHEYYQNMDHTSSLAEWADLMSFSSMDTLDSVIREPTPEAIRFIAVSLHILRDNRTKRQNLYAAIQNMCDEIATKEADLNDCQESMYLNGEAAKRIIPIKEAAISTDKDAVHTLSLSLAELTEHDNNQRMAVLRAYIDAIKNRGFKNSIDILGACESLSAHQQQCQRFTQMLNMTDNSIQNAGIRNMFTAMARNVGSDFKNVLLNTNAPKEQEHHFQDTARLSFSSSSEEEEEEQMNKLTLAQ